MAGAPKKKEVQRVTIEIKGHPKPKPKEWAAFKREISETLEAYPSIKAKIVEIAYVVKRLDRR
jgi:hypothetical protein